MRYKTLTCTPIPELSRVGSFYSHNYVASVLKNVCKNECFETMLC